MWNDIYQRFLRLPAWQQTGLVCVTASAIFVGAQAFRYRRAIKERIEQLEEWTPHIMVRYDPSEKTTTNNGTSTGEEQDDKYVKKDITIKALELNPRFVQKYSTEKGWRMMSLGQYLSSLRPARQTDNQELSSLIHSELEGILGLAILKTLGPRWGRIALPGVGNPVIRDKLETVSANSARWWASKFLSTGLREEVDNVLTGKDNNNNDGDDRAVVPLTLQAASTLANVNQHLNKDAPTPQVETPPLDLMKIGEVGYEPSYDAMVSTTKSTDTSTSTVADAGSDDTDNVDMDMVPLIPNPFIVEEHWDAALRGMEELIKKSNPANVRIKDTKVEESTPANKDKTDEMATYDPNDRSLPAPTLLNESLLPDLYLGWGDAQCTHTKQEILRNRLLCVLLNRLGYNYYRLSQTKPAKSGTKTDCAEFVVCMKRNKPEIRRPHEFVDALVKAGHKVSVCPRTALTTFGNAVCVKERDGTFTNIPIAFFLESGYEDADGRDVYTHLVHTGVDLDIEGPLVGKRADGKPNRCNIQHYIAIEGLCGWHSNHNADVPWVQAVSFNGKPYESKATALEAVRASALSAVVLNAVGTEMNLPFGGYGLTGVCSDSTALVDMAATNKFATNVQQLTSTGRFLCHMRRRMEKLRNKLAVHKELKRDTDALGRLMQATMTVGSDLHPTPAQAGDSARRMSKCMPANDDVPFQLNVESMKRMEQIAKEMKK